MANRTNYYIALDLDPKVEDQEVIRAAIETKRREWSRQRMQNPALSAQAQACLDLIGDMVRVMASPEDRHREAEEARRILS